MAAIQKPAESAGGNSSVEYYITELTPYDVLLGRGTSIANYKGNVAFRAICDERKEEYTSIVEYKPKARIAKEILAKIHALGGRFLKQVEHETTENGRLREEEEQVKYVEASEKIALEKIKQALREQRDKMSETVEHKRKERENEALLELNSSQQVGLPPFTSAADASTVASDTTDRIQGSVPASEFVSPIIPSMLLANGGMLSLPSFESRLLMFQVMQQQQQRLLQQHLIEQQRLSQLNFHSEVASMPLGTNGDPQALMQDLYNRYMAEQIVRASLQGHGLAEAATSGHVEKMNNLQHTAMEVHGMAPESRAGLLAIAKLPGEQSSDDDNAALALSLLSVASQAMTKEEEEMEKASMTNEERAAVLADMFGKMCLGVRPKNKKARRDLGRDSIEFLIKFMKQEIDAIPSNQKGALLEAQTKARPEEFCDARLERFLRCDGMDAKLAAHRFINYWESRRQVFGEEKYLLPMTLSEAARDDTNAIEAGMYCLLPKKDLSGRQLIFCEPHRHTGEGYTSESMLRALWYEMEVTAQETTEINSGVVLIVWDKFSRISDYERKVWQPFMRFMTSVWPIKNVAIHSCCTPPFVVRIIKPILFALADKHLRSRVVFHNPESEIINSLSDYGILKDMVPNLMGGTALLDRKAWIAHRRAVEMEEAALT